MYEEDVGHSDNRLVELEAGFVVENSSDDLRAQVLDHGAPLLRKITDMLPKNSAAS